MVRALSPEDAQALIEAGGIRIIDVREAGEWAQGHIPGANLVPLATVKSDPKRHLSHDNILLVCARGVRSLTAAKLAADLGYGNVYHLDGGMEAWQAAKLAVETPAAAAPAGAVAPEAAGDARTTVGTASCGLPEPGLDVVVGANMRQLRTSRGLSLDELAGMTGVSRTVLGQIELGKTPPSVSMVWKIAQAFGVPFSTMLANAAPRLEHALLRADEAKRLVSPDGRFSSRALFPFGEKPPAEFYELFLAAHSREDAEAHQPGTRENLIVTAGRLELHIGSEMFQLGKGDAMVFAADVPHAYVNPGNQECWMYLVMTYAT